jgi:hypothetical protein
MAPRILPSSALTLPMTTSAFSVVRVTPTCPPPLLTSLPPALAFASFLAIPAITKAIAVWTFPPKNSHLAPCVFNEASFPLADSRASITNLDFLSELEESILPIEPTTAGTRLTSPATSPVAVAALVRLLLNRAPCCCHCHQSQLHHVRLPLGTRHSCLRLHHAQPRRLCQLQPQRPCRLHP